MVENALFDTEHLNKSFFRAVFLEYKNIFKWNTIFFSFIQTHAKRTIDIIIVCLTTIHRFIGVLIACKSHPLPLSALGLSIIFVKLLNLLGFFVKLMTLFLDLN